MGIVKRVIKKNKVLMYCAACIKGLFEPDVMDKIIDVIFGYNSFKINHLGDKNIGVIIYYIYIDQKSGFCVLYKNVLKYLWLAEKYGFTPVIEFSKSTKYTELESAEFCINSFDNYFVQPGNISIEDAKDSSNVIFSKLADLRCFSENLSYDITEKELMKLAMIHRKYLSVKPEIVNSFLSEFETMFQNKRVLGIHIRGTDFKKNYKNHPMYISEERFIDEAKKICHRYDCIFLATDDKMILEKFRSEFKERLFFNQCERSEDGVAIHFNKKVEAGRNYRIGLEVLKDVFTLAQCSAMICGRSNVPTMARIVNSAYYSPYEEVVILDDGTNTKGRTLVVRK